MHCLYLIPISFHGEKYYFNVFMLHKLVDSQYFNVSTYDALSISDPYPKVNGESTISMSLCSTKMVHSQYFNVLTYDATSGTHVPVRHVGRRWSPIKMDRIQHYPNPMAIPVQQKTGR